MAPVSILLRASEATCTPRAPVHGECLRACKRSVREVPRFHTQAPMLRERGIAAFSMNKSSSAVQRGAQDGKTQVLFVCLGNICRSPTAEAVFQAVVDRRCEMHSSTISLAQPCCVALYPNDCERYLPGA